MKQKKLHFSLKKLHDYFLTGLILFCNEKKKSINLNTTQIPEIPHFFSV